jgi:hypothetical protein
MYLIGGLYKKILFRIIVALIIFMISSYANLSGSSNPNYFSYTTSGSQAKAIITGLPSAWTNAGKSAIITIPASINGYSVTSIGSNAFANCTWLTSITIPSSVTSIGENAFNGCDGLTSITIPSSVSSIGDSVLYGCSGLTSITIPSSVTSFGSYAFAGCEGLTSITIPSSVTSIGGGAFMNCTGLTIVHENATTPPSIGATIFRGCSALTITVLAGYTGNYSSWTASYLGCTSVTIK